jgi:regulator of protease activity HflC (stomatin/prohibitin superfamily)
MQAHIENRKQDLRSATLAHERHLWLLLSICLGGLLIGALWKRVFITISAGHRGVLFKRLGGGTQTDRILDEGLYIIAPWNQLTAYETRLQTRTMQLKLPSEEGLEMNITVALRYRPSVQNLGYLHKDVGPEYFERLVAPEVQGHLRKVLGRKKAQDIYAGSREILDEIANLPVIGRLRREVDGGANQLPAQPYVLLEELRVLDIERPAVVADAVSEKMRQEQLALQYKHKLQREEQEAARKRIEAAGIRDFKQISGTDIMSWRNIEATTELARSNNAKVIVLGNGQTNLPMMLNLPDDVTKRDTQTLTTARSEAPQSAFALPSPKPNGPEPRPKAASAGP